MRLLRSAPLRRENQWRAETPEKNKNTYDVRRIHRMVVQVQEYYYLFCDTISVGLLLLYYHRLTHCMRPPTKSTESDASDERSKWSFLIRLSSAKQKDLEIHVLLHSSTASCSCIQMIDRPSSAFHSRARMSNSRCHSISIISFGKSFETILVASAVWRHKKRRPRKNGLYSYHDIALN